MHGLSSYYVIDISRLIRVGKGDDKLKISIIPTKTHSPDTTEFDFFLFVFFNLFNFYFVSLTFFIYLFYFLDFLYVFCGLGILLLPDINKNSMLIEIKIFVGILLVKLDNWII